MSTNHGMDESDIIELVSNDQSAHEASVRLGAQAVNDYDNDDPTESWDLCKSVGEDIRDDVVREQAWSGYGVRDWDRNLTECLFSRMLGCVDWAEVGRHYIGQAIEAVP